MVFGDTRNKIWDLPSQRSSSRLLFSLNFRFVWKVKYRVKWWITCCKIFSILTIWIQLCANKFKPWALRRSSNCWSAPRGSQTASLGLTAIVQFFHFGAIHYFLRDIILSAIHHSLSLSGESKTINLVWPAILRTKKKRFTARVEGQETQFHCEVG